MFTKCIKIQIDTSIYIFITIFPVKGRQSIEITIGKFDATFTKLC